MEPVLGNAGSESYRIVGAPYALELIRREPAALNHATPILFVHGGWHGAWCWDAYFSGFFADHGWRSLALSLRGHCGSEGKRRLKLHRVRDYLADVKAVIDSLPVAPAVVAHSLGGFVMQHYLAKYGSHSLRALVLLAPVPPYGLWRITTRAAIGYPFRFLGIHLTWSLKHVINRPELARDFLFSASMPEEELRKHFEKLQDESYLAFWDGLAIDLAMHRRPAMSALPKLVLAAQNDKMTRLPHASLALA
jgi:pimeloyl-ACP methyl ester carboxylesterase